MAKIIKVTGYLLAHDDVDENEIALAAGDILSSKFDCIDKPFATESAPLEVSFFDDEWNDHPLNRIDCPMSVCEGYFEEKQPANIQISKTLWIDGEEYVPGNVIDHLCWRLDSNTEDELYGAILRDITEYGIIVWDSDNGCDVFIPAKDIIERSEFNVELADVPFD